MDQPVDEEPEPESTVQVEENAGAPGDGDFKNESRAECEELELLAASQSEPVAPTANVTTAEPVQVPTSAATPESMADGRDSAATSSGGMWHALLTRWHREHPRGHPISAAVGGQQWVVVNHDGHVLLQDDGTPWSLGLTDIEHLLDWMLKAAVHGIPNLEVGGALDRAMDLLARHGCEVEAAVADVVAGSEAVVPACVLDLCLEQLPVFACSKVLLSITWVNLRSVLIIAALFGQSLKLPRVQHEALLCLVSQAEGVRANWDSAHFARVLFGSSPFLPKTVTRVAGILVKSMLREEAGSLGTKSCLEIAPLLYNTSDSLKDDDFVCVMPTPAAAARDVFQTICQFSCARLWRYLSLLLLGIAAPGIFDVAKWVPKLVGLTKDIRLPSSSITVLLALPSLYLAFGISGVTQTRRRARRWVHERWFYQVFAGAAGEHGTQSFRNSQPQVWATIVFIFHALLATFSSYFSVSLMCDSIGMAISGDIPFSGHACDHLHTFARFMLGSYSFCQCVLICSYNSQSTDEECDARRTRVQFAMETVCHATGTVAKVSSWMAASLYLLAMSDLIAAFAASWWVPTLNTGITSFFGVNEILESQFGIGHHQSAVWFVRAVSFGLHLLSACSQWNLLKLLFHREVLLNLIGADLRISHSICLLLSGVDVAPSGSKSAQPIADFLGNTLPPPVTSLLIVAVRVHSVVLGATVALAPTISCGSAVLSNSSLLLVGFLIGAYATQAMMGVWHNTWEDISSPGLRLAHLLPGSMSGQAKELLVGVSASVRKRSARAVAIGFIQQFVRWCFPSKNVQPSAPITTASG